MSCSRAAFFLAAAVILSAQPPKGAGGPPRPQPIPSGVKVEENITFAKVGPREIRLDLYRPEHPAGKLPTVVWIFGGAWAAHARDVQSATGAFLATHGYAVASIDYRVSSEALWPAQIQDCKAAVRWLRANAGRYGLDSGRIGAWGASSGGHLASMLGTTGGVRELEGDEGNPGQSSRVHAVVDFFGPTDFLQMDAHHLPNGMLHDKASSPESLLVGGPIQENKDKVQRANPITYIAKDCPPFLILHGEQDLLVPLHQSVLLYDALCKAGVNATFFKIAGAGHGGSEFDSPVVQAMVLAFFDQYLKGAK